MEGSFRGWPNGIKAAVSLSSDDGPPSQLDKAVPILDQHGIKGTFYVNPVPGPRFERHVARWQAAMENGHELANHTVSHPCSGNFGFVSAERALELWSLERIEADVLQAEEALRRWLRGIKEHSFAYPCGQTFVGRGSERRSYVPVIARHFRVARGLGESANDPRICDLHCLSSWMVVGVTGEQMISMLQPAIEAVHWDIFCFHGIGGDHHRVDVEPYEELVRYLAEQAPQIWTATVQEVGLAVAEIQQKARS